MPRTLDTEGARTLLGRRPREGGGPEARPCRLGPRLRGDDGVSQPASAFACRDGAVGITAASWLRGWHSIAIALLLAFGLALHPRAEASDAGVLDLEYRALLLDLGQRDQLLRTSLSGCARQPVDDRPACLQRMRDTDVEHMAELHALLWSRGWPLASRVGEDAAFSAFLVIQHAHSGVQAAALPAVSLSVWQGELRPAALALLTDRVLTRAGRPQRYGTQSMRWPLWPATVRLPVLEPEKLDERRRALGLSPLP